LWCLRKNTPAVAKCVVRSMRPQPAPSAPPAWSIRLIEEFDANDRRTVALAGGLSSTQLNWRPREDAWSVGQCLHHLLVANQVYLPPIEKALEGRRASPVPEITPGWFGRWFIRTVIEPSPQSRRRKAPGKIVPLRRVEPSILDEFLRSNAAVRDLVRKASAYDVNHIRFRNPFVPLIHFTAGPASKSCRDINGGTCCRPSGSRRSPGSRGPSRGAYALPPWPTPPLLSPSS
jgi:DinB superfamily